MDDLSFIKKALALAKKGIGQVSPNPLVGALLVKDGVIVGKGFHTYEAKTHAEAKAIAAAGEKARGSTLYINLEPCSHRGRTPPCADAIIQAGIKRVVASLQDPNPDVSGEGLRRLRAAGIEVDVGLYRHRAARLNETFIKYIQYKTPFVLLKAGMSLDGKIATKTGQSKWITSSRAREYVQKLRWEYDAVLVGVNTVIRDDPELTLRINKPKHRPLIKVILDSQLRTPLNSRTLRPQDRGRVIIFTSEKSKPEGRKALEERGVTVHIAPTKNNHIDLSYVCKTLGQEQVSSLMIEGGSEVNWNALEQKVVDKVVFIAASKIVGGKQAVPVVGGEGIESLSSCFHLNQMKAFSLGSDIVIEGYM